MNISEIKKNLKRINLLIVLNFIALFLSIALMTLLITQVVLGIITGDFFDFTYSNITLIISSSIVATFYITISVVVLVYMIIVSIYAFEFKNKAYAILLTIGILIRIVCIVGLFMFANFIKKQINQLENESKTPNKTNTF